MSSPAALEILEEVVAFLEGEAHASAETISRLRRAIGGILDTEVARGVDVRDQQALAASMSSDNFPTGFAVYAAATVRRYLAAKAKGQRYFEERQLLQDFEEWMENMKVKGGSQCTYLSHLRKACEVIGGNNLPWLKDGATARLLGDAAGYAKLFSTAQLQVLKKLIKFFDARKDLPAPVSSASSSTFRRRREEERMPVKRPRAGPSAKPVMAGAYMGQQFMDASALGPGLEAFYPGSFFIGNEGRFLVHPPAEGSGGLAVGLCVQQEPPGRALLIGIQAERYETSNSHGPEVKMYGQAGADFEHSMVAAMTAVRIRSAAICKLLDVQDESRFGYLEEAGHRVILLITPHALSKGGSSAALAAVVALVASLTGRPIRPGVVLTGDLSFSGRVMEVGGMEEKLEGARRAGLRLFIGPQASIECLPPQEQQSSSIPVVQPSGRGQPAHTGDGGERPHEEQTRPGARRLEARGQSSMQVRGVERLEEALSLAFGVELPPTDGASQEWDDAPYQDADGPCSGMGGGLPSRLPLNPGVYHGIGQSMTWKNQGQWDEEKSSIQVLAVEVECILHPGVANTTVLGGAPDSPWSVPINMDAQTAVVWVIKYQDSALWPRGGKFAGNLKKQIKELDVAFKVNPSGLLTETHLGAAYLVALISAVTGYKLHRRAGVVGTVTVDGVFSAMATVNMLDVLLMLESGLHVIVVPKASLESINRIRQATCPTDQPHVRFVGVEHICEALPHLLQEYPLERR